jgi:chlorobactene glucosyltransferase
MLIAVSLSPWVFLALYLVVRVRLPRPLPCSRMAGAGLVKPGGRPVGPESATPFVSVIVPARNEQRNIEECLGSLTAMDYPEFEILVVDDQSEDDTATLARAADPGRSRALTVLEGGPLPAGWFGKPWACWQGAKAARGDLLLFTDADTIHGPRLLARAVAGLREDDADALTVLGRQIMGSFWERLVQPQFFVLLLLRYPDAHRPVPRRRWLDAIANGQYILVDRRSYERIGGHRAVSGEVVEDLRLAQELVRAGGRLSVREAEGDLATRMYRSLGELVEGWAKNLLTASHQSVPRWAKPVIAPAALAAAGFLWLLPPATLAGCVVLASLGSPSALTSDPAVWATLATAGNVLFWTAASARLGAPPAYGALYPLGTAVASYVFLLSWGRGSRIRWKGRRYTRSADGARAR